ncbi:hypothetical protein GW950_01170 [Candidatus Wolfebacteria bacterium]|nr:hypothetical protein [Candidatus Wolfebacteria bacterium]
MTTTFGFIWKSAVILLAIFGGFILFLFFLALLGFVYAVYKQMTETVVNGDNISITRVIDKKTFIRYVSRKGFEMTTKGSLWSGDSLSYIRNPHPGIMWQVEKIKNLEVIVIMCLEKNELIAISPVNSKGERLQYHQFKESEYYDIVEEARRASAFIRETVAPILKKYKASFL